MKFLNALQQYTEAAEHYRAYQSQAEGNSTLEQWARERVIAMIKKAETFQKLTKKPVTEAEVDQMIFDLPSVPTTPKAGQAVAPGGPAAGVPPPRPVSAPPRPVPAGGGIGKLPNSLTSSFVRGRNKGTDLEQKVICDFECDCDCDCDCDCHRHCHCVIVKVFVIGIVGTSSGSLRSRL